MARGLFLMTCGLLVLAVHHGALSHSLTQNKSTLRHAQTESRSSLGGGLGAVVAYLLADRDNNMKQQINSMKTDLRETRTELQKTQKKLLKTENDLQVVKESGLKTDLGSAFVRWGRKTCPANTTLVYSGVAGGKKWDEKGSGTNRLCLTSSPQFDNAPVPRPYGHLYGAEYEFIPGHFDQDVPCSVCRAPQSTTIMMAATLTCPLGWTAQYTGHLAADRFNHFANEYVCLDGSPEYYTGGHRDDNQNVFILVTTVCGSLPCPPYEGGKVVTCVVCSR